MLKARSTFDFTWAKNKTNKIKNSIDVSWRCTWYLRFQNSYLKGTYTYSILVCTSNYFLPTIMVNVLLFKSVCDFLLNRKSGEIVMNKKLIILHFVTLAGRGSVLNIQITVQFINHVYKHLQIQ